jgi:signal transduction histidine kinase
LKQAQEQLLKAEKLAAMGEVAAMVGHDLRNPLQVITNTLYLSGKKSKFITITEKEILEKHGFSELRSGLKEQVEYMDKIVSDLQDYARPMKRLTSANQQDALIVNCSRKRESLHSDRGGLSQADA